MDIVYLLLAATVYVIHQCFAEQLKASYSSPFIMTCHHDELSNLITWSYNGSDVFSCEAPYRAGQCKVPVSLDRQFIFNIDTAQNTSSLTVTNDSIIASWKEANATWTCSHNKKSAEYTFTNTVSPRVTSFTREPSGVVDENQPVTLTCAVETEIPYTVTWSSVRRGTLSTTTMQAGDTSSFEITTQCTDNIDTFTCTIDNGESNPVFQTNNVTVKCETKFLPDEMITTINAQIGTDVVLTAFYTGNEPPKSFDWHRKLDNREIQLTGFRTRRIDDGPYVKQMILYSVEPQDSGIYIFELTDAHDRIYTMFTVNVCKSPPTVPGPPFSWFVGIGIGAGGVLVIIILILAIICLVRKKCGHFKNTDDGYLEPELPKSCRPTGSSEMYDSSRSHDSFSETYDNIIRHEDDNF